MELIEHVEHGKEIVSPALEPTIPLSYLVSGLTN